MKLRYKNFKGKTYFVRQSRTKTGKIKYICSTKESDSDLEALPDGMDFYENAIGLVSIREKLISRITGEEFQLVQTECKRLAAPHFVRFELSEDAISVHSAKRIDLSMFGLLGKSSDDGTYDYLTYSSFITPCLRFTLVDEKKRTFSVERMCFMGAEDEWYFLECGKLADLVRKYAPHIEKESMFDFL